MENKFSKHLTGSRKSHNTQHYLLRMTESGKAQLNNGTQVRAIIMDLSKSFDNLNLTLLLIKPKAYGLDNNSVKFFRS